ncbi:MAG: hypothetical protein L6Q76_04610 [Polyangiaceae bacterium]|nr:hypothetical protein [Polyangiaceae bacterium]
MKRAGSIAFAGVLLIALASAAPPASAHGGEDHGAPEPEIAAVVGTTHVGSGETATFSVVVKYPAAPAEGPLTMRVYVADTDSSAPIAGATVRVELKGEVTMDQEAKATGSPGVYEATVPAPPNGAHADGIVSVQTKTAFDLVTLGKLSFGPMDVPAAATEEHPEEIPIWQAAAGALGLAVLAGGAGFGIGRRSRRRKSQDAEPHEKSTPAGATP